MKKRFKRDTALVELPNELRIRLRTYAKANGYTFYGLVRIICDEFLKSKNF